MARRSMDEAHQSDTPKGVHDTLRDANNVLATGDEFNIQTVGADPDYQGKHRSDS
jgi:hypothetical protein